MATEEDWIYEFNEELHERVQSWTSEDFRHKSTEQIATILIALSLSRIASTLQDRDCPIRVESV